MEEVLAASETPSLADIQIGCFLALKGQAGLPLIQNRYLTNPQATFAEFYSAILALRFVSDLPNSPLSKESIIASFRLVLRNARMADLVVSDLIRLEDWESLDRLVELYKEPDVKWVRVSIVRFVRECPTEMAKQRLQELTEFDAAAVRRANRFSVPEKDTREKVSLRRHYGRNGIFRC